MTLDFIDTTFCLLFNNFFAEFFEFSYWFLLLLTNNMTNQILPWQWEIDVCSWNVGLSG